MIHLEKNYLPIDKAFAKHFLAEEKSEECTAFLCYLLASARAGHLCVHINEETLLPHPEEIWPDIEDTHEAVSKFLKSGLEKMPSRLISSTLSTPIYRDEMSCYLQKNWILETKAIELFANLLQSKPEIELEMEKVEETLNCYLADSILTKEQAKVIRVGCQNSLTLISGGPGTGKTYTAGHLLSLLSQSEELEIMLAAPTGKAAARLQSSIQSAARHPINLKAKTLHSLLNVSKSRENEEVILSADVVLIDECSMIDVKMMVKLLSSLKKGARLILLGDPYQLPPVESGNLFADFVFYLAKHEAGRFAELSECLRVESKDLIHFARTINQGECQAALHLIECLSSTGSVTCAEKGELEDLMDSHYRALEEQLVDDEVAAIKLFEKFRVLSPLRKGPMGVEAINHLIDQRRRKNSHRTIPIILRRHAKAFDLFNGDTGVLVLGKENEAYALFEKKEGQTLSTLKIPAYLLPDYELAYCLSVHKCQGSEYSQVLLVLPKGSQVFGRQALYTAVTRAKNKLILCSESDVFKKMVGCQFTRQSGVEKRMKQKRV